MENFNPEDYEKKLRIEYELKEEFRKKRNQKMTEAIQQRVDEGKEWIDAGCFAIGCCGLVLLMLIMIVKCSGH